MHKGEHTPSSSAELNCDALCVVQLVSNLAGHSDFIAADISSAAPGMAVARHNLGFTLRHSFGDCFYNLKVCVADEVLAAAEQLINAGFLGCGWGGFIQCIAACAAGYRLLTAAAGKAECACPVQP